MNNSIKDICLEYIKKLNELENLSFDIHKSNLHKKLNNTFSGVKDASFKSELDIKNFIDPYIEYRKEMDILFSKNKAIYQSLSNKETNQTEYKSIKENLLLMVELFKNYKAQANALNHATVNKK